MENANTSVMSVREFGIINKAIESSKVFGISSVDKARVAFRKNNIQFNSRHRNFILSSMMDVCRRK